MNKVHGHSPPPLDGHLVERVIAQVLVKVVYLLHVTVGVQNHFWLYAGLLVLFLVFVSLICHTYFSSMNCAEEQHDLSVIDPQAQGVSTSLGPAPV